MNVLSLFDGMSCDMKIIIRSVVCHFTDYVNSVVR